MGDTESQGSKPRDHQHPRHHILHRPHRDWRVWVAVLLMLGMILVYVTSDDLRFWHHKPVGPPVPAAVGP